jgi:hypothetical protein
MGIENIHLFIHPDVNNEPARAPQTRRRNVSRHKVDGEAGRYTFVYGWDQPLQSFYLQKHDKTRAEDEQIIVWLGATADSRMYEVEDLVRVAKKNGLYISHEMRVKLYGEKDDGV